LAGREELDAAAGRLEALYLGLRTDAGGGASAVPAALRDRWVDEQWARVESGQLRLTADGWLRLDALVSAVPDP
jgi:hypothetical protein